MADETLLKELESIIPCRVQQAKQLALLLDPSLPNPSNLVAYGTEATGKSLTICEVLHRLPVPHAIIESRECITGRHLLERTVSIVKHTLADTDLDNPPVRIDKHCESLSALAVQLQLLLSQVSRFILVFDGVDRQREAPPTLLPALARLGELIPSLTIILVVTHPRPRFLHLLGVPHVHFPPYTRAETIEVLSLWTPEIYSAESPAAGENDSRYGPAEHAEDAAWLWNRFCGATWDSMGKGAARDISSFRNVCQRLWLPFVAPIRRGEYGTRDFARLMVRNRALFQNEVALRDSLVEPSVLTEADFDDMSVASRKRAMGKGSTHELPYYTKFLLIAAFLGSQNPARTDAVFFMKMHERKRKKKGGGAAKSRGPGGAGVPKHRTIQRKLLGPQPFPLERWLAIFHAIVPHDVTAGTADLLTQVATLSALRLIIKASASANVMDPGAKWRANVGWEYVQALAKSVRFEVQDHLAE